MVRAMPRRTSGAFALVGLVAFACHRAEPPSPFGIDAAVAPLPPPGGDGGASPTSTSTSTSTNVDAGSSVTANVDAGPDPGTLPQTRDKPEASGAAFDARVAALWEAIVKDEPERGMAFFFPVTAYEQVKAISNASSDWRRRLVAAYKRDVHALHARLGDHAADAKLVRADVPQDRARWVEPNEEFNKLGYYRVYGTRLVYEVDGKERSLEVTSLISWRGEWYVVHLSGFK
ncbi:MAG: hypothetical protein JWP87_3156 [Labilithrix sp.]|nr:hypothetical protein [Labilithrix sp.]